MDFIEKLFGIAPDDGNGLWEAAIVLSIAIAAGFRMLRRGRSAAARRK